MTIDYSRIGSVTARQLHRAVIADGISLHRQRGSHRRYRHPDGRRVTLSFHHASDTFPRKTLKRIIETQARWTEDDLTRLNLRD